MSAMLFQMAVKDLSIIFFLLDRSVDAKLEQIGLLYSFQANSNVGLVFAKINLNDPKRGGSDCKMK